MRKFALSIVVVGILSVLGCQSKGGSASDACGGAACGGSSCAGSACGGAACGSACGGESTDAVKYENIVMVAWHADWCGTCKKIGPTVMEVSKEVAKMTKLDFTDDDTTAASKELAEELGITKAWENESGTGFVIIYNKNNPDDYRKLKGSTNAADYEKLFKEMN